MAADRRGERHAPISYICRIPMEAPCFQWLDLLDASLSHSDYKNDVSRSRKNVLRRFAASDSAKPVSSGTQYPAASCDTVVVIDDDTRRRRVIFAKNSDRSGVECQPLVLLARDFPFAPEAR